VWVEILLAKYFNHQPTERLLAAWKLLGLDLAASTLNAGLERLQPLFLPIYQALQERNRLSAYQQADETRWLVFVEKDGKQGHRWWLWVFNGEDTVVYVLDPARSHDVPEGHFTAGISIVLMVDRFASYKAMAPVKAGLIVLAFCWAHVRRDFISVAKSFPELKPWALAWLRQIRQAYRCNGERLAQLGTSAFAALDGPLRLVMDQMKTTAAAELADPQLRQPCRKVLVSLQEHWTGLTRFVDDPRIPMDNNASERSLRGAALGRKNYYGSNAEWSGTLAMTLFSVFALALAGLGIYGVVSYSVNQRTREIGIRMALGARRGEVLGLIVAQGLVLALIGVMAGLAGAYTVTRAMAGLLYGVRPMDPLTLVAVSSLLMAVALVATLVPAWRASRVDPTVALRYE